MLDQLLPIDTAVTLHEWPHDTLAAYDMLNKKPLNAEEVEGGWRFPVSLDTRGGTVIALYPKALAQVRIAAPARIAPGTDSALAIYVEDGEGVPVTGLQPLKVDITRADGNASAYSGYYCVKDGVLYLPIGLGLNAPTGSWGISVEDLTAGLTVQASVVVGVG